ncbi:2OG-Fe(II) oxygenase [Streptomyces sp. NBC_01565]|uniref:2OG-Fe(II) oxygenase n=1 Tax=unclassified Streptomyces TaxID=2593676 RepID=UPI002257ECC8|nr:2OG-Fe(II) oxygenase [Streptomyces sp. NBC_01565]MCX4546306.1 2OG-Fe(II) oxygenase [Streptomyces sp. NBC_01565]
MAVNPFGLSQDTLHGISADDSWAPTVSEIPQVGARVVRHFLTSVEVKLLAAEIEAQRLVPTGRDGILANYSQGDPIGSLRATADSSALAAEFYRRLQSCLSLDVGPDDPTDSDGRPWRAVSVNPRMRFIKYERGGLLVPHYDSPYLAPNGTRTLLTVVIYLSHEAVGGETRFIVDKQNDLPFAQRDFSDWPRLAEPEEILTAHHPEPGDALLFWHRTLHDSAPILEGAKTILRTDVLYEAVGAP